MSKGLSLVLEKIEKISIGGLVDINLRKEGEQEDLYKNLKDLIQHDEDTFIVVDELTLFLGILKRSENGAAKVAFILNWLRSLRQVGQTKVRWLFCGSVGLRNFTSAMNLSFTINDLTELELDELSRDEAIGLLTRLCESEEIAMSEDIINYSLDKLHWNIPYFIQIIFSKLLEEYNGEINRGNIDSAYDKLCSENYLNTWSERLVEYMEYEIPARQILKSLAINPLGLDREKMFDILMTGQNASSFDEVDHMLSKVLEMLENDGYILKKGGIRVFRSPLLRDYWYNKFVQ